MRGAGVYAVPGSWSSLTQVRSLSCVVVDLSVKECIWFTSHIAPRHWIVTFRKHVFPVFRSPRPDFVGEGLFSTFRLGSQGSRGGCSFFTTFLRAESCLVSAPCLEVGAWEGVMRLTGGVRFLGSGVGSGKACGVEFCFVCCGGLFFSVFSPSSFLSSYFVRLPILSSFSLPLFPGPVFLRRVYSHVGQGGVGRFPHCSFVHTRISASLLLHLLRGLLLPSSSLPVL